MNSAQITAAINAMRFRQNHGASNPPDEIAEATWEIERQAALLREEIEPRI